MLAAKRFFQLIAQRFQREEGVRDKRHHQRGHGANGIDQTKRQQHAIKVRCAVQDHRIGERQRRAGNALTAANGHGQGIERIFQADLQHRLQRATLALLAQPLAQPAQYLLVRVAPLQQACAQLGGQQMGGAVVGGLGAQVVAHRGRTASQGVHERAHLLHRAHHGQGLARQIARFHQDHAPLLARLPIAVVAGVDAKAQKNRQGHAHERKRHRRERHLPVKHLPVQQHDQGR